MNQGPVPPGPGRDDDPPGVPAGPADFPELGSPGWRLAPSSADWPEWMEDGAYLDDEDPGDPGEEEDPDSAPPPGLDDAGLAALIAEAREVTADQARAAAVAARLGDDRGAGRGPARRLWPGGARGCPGPRSRLPGSTPAGRRGSLPASR